MKKVFSSDLMSDVSEVCALLQANGIGATVLNEHVATTPGVPGRLTVQMFPEVWIFDENLFDEAREKIKNFKLKNRHGEENSARSTEWICTACTESNPKSFEICWKCGSSR